MKELIHFDETIEDLQLNGLKLIQKKSSFRFGMDSVLLADFAAIRANETVADLGTGNGALIFLLSGRGKGNHYYAIDIQQEAAELVQRNAILNRMEDRITVINADAGGYFDLYQSMLGRCSHMQSAIRDAGCFFIQSVQNQITGAKPGKVDHGASAHRSIQYSERKRKSFSYLSRTTDAVPDEKPSKSSSRTQTISVGLSLCQQAGESCSDRSSQGCETNIASNASSDYI